MKNPFQNTKASYFEDPEIIKYWVSPNKNDDDFFNTIMLPESAIPIRILGGKGSGKTHILRYFSYKSQIIRANNEKKDILTYIQEQGYIGVYIVSSGLNVNRFSGRGIEKEYWKNIFYYYINLEFVERVTNKIINIYKESNNDLTKDIDIDSDLSIDFKSKTIVDFYNLIKEHRESIDDKINVLSFPGSDTSSLNGIKPIFRIGDGFYNIVKKLLDNFEAIKDVKILFIIDEFENFSKYQQIFFNTLLRHPKHVKNIAIRISGRLYAIKTNNTLDDEEKLLEDSEIKTIILENLLEKSFPEFAKKIYESRINEGTEVSFKSIDFNNTFETSRDANNNTVNDITKRVSEKPLLSRPYFSKFITNIKKEYDSADKINIEQLLENLSFPDAFTEKVNTFLCYQNWDVDLNYFGSLIAEMRDAGNLSLQKNAIDKFGIDLTYQLLRESQRSYYYGGFKNILRMSQNNPRIFLSILNNTFIECKLGQNINMFTEIVPCKLQNNALLETSIWFWNNFTEDVKDHRAVWAVKELCDFFRKVRQAYKPSEKTLISFAYNPNEVTPEINEIINIAVNHSLLIESTQQRIDKNTAILQRQLKVHPMLSPKWELPLSVGGTIVFKKHEIEALFNKNEEAWKEYSLQRLKTLNPPFKKSKKVKATSDEEKKSIQPQFDWGE